MSKVKVGLVQMSCTKDKQENLDKAIAKVREAAAKGAQIVCLPELFLTHYFCQEENHDNFAIAEKIPGKTTNTLCELAKKISVIIIVPLFEKKVSGLYHNSCVVIDEKGKIFGHYRKMHIVAIV